MNHFSLIKVYIVHILDLVRVRRDDNTVEGGTVHDDRKVVCYYANWAVYR